MEPDYAGKGHHFMTWMPNQEFHEMGYTPKNLKIPPWKKFETSTNTPRIFGVQNVTRPVVSIFFK